MLFIMIIEHHVLDTAVCWIFTDPQCSLLVYISVTTHMWVTRCATCSCPSVTGDGDFPAPLWSDGPSGGRVICCWLVNTVSLHKPGRCSLHTPRLQAWPMAQGCRHAWPELSIAGNCNTMVSIMHLNIPKRGKGAVKTVDRIKKRCTASGTDHERGPSDWGLPWVSREWGCGHSCRLYKHCN